MTAWSDVFRLTPLGRIRREAYWGACAASALLFGAALAAAGNSAVLVFRSSWAALDASGWGFLVVGAVLAAISLALLVCASARRLRDAGAAPGWALLLLAPGLNAAAILVFGLLPSQASETRARKAPTAAGVHSPALSAMSGAPAFAPELDADGRPSPAQFLWEQTVAGCAGESLSLQLQVKVRAVDKLRKLVKKGELDAEAFELWRRRLMAIDPDHLARPR